MKLFPQSASSQLEFDKIKNLLIEHSKTEYAKNKAAELRIHTKKDFIDLELRQTYEYKLIVLNSQYFPNDYVNNLQKDIRLLSIPGAA